MTVQQLIDLLKSAEPTATVSLQDIYGDGDGEITGMVYNSEGVCLTNEDLS